LIFVIFSSSVIIIFIIIFIILLFQIIHWTFALESFINKFAFVFVMKKILGKDFFGKDSCLKAYLNEKLDFYFEFGKKTDSWSWKKVKMNDLELGEIILVLENKKTNVSFFHDFKGDKTQIWVNKDKFFFIKVKELSKSLSDGEQIILRELLKYAILRMNMTL